MAVAGYIQLRYRPSITHKRLKFEFIIEYTQITSLKYSCK